MYVFFFGVIPLPVTPAAFDIVTPSLNKTVVLIDQGEINIPRDAGLLEISFDFLLPRQRYHFSNYNLSDYTASTLIPLLNLWKKTKLPFQFIVTRIGAGGQVYDFTNIKVAIEGFTYKEDAAAYGTDTMCSITLKEYKDPQPASLIMKVAKYADEVVQGAVATALVATVQKSRSTTGKSVPKTYIVKQGDTLWSICKKELGNGDKWRDVAKLNNIKNPDLIQVGQKLRLS